jgi:ketosteroid isomerase-like protein
MSQENLKVALNAVGAVANMDADKLVRLTDPEVEWFSLIAQLGEGGVYRGHGGIRQYVGDLRDAFELFQSEVHETCALGEVVLLFARLRYRGKESGIETEVTAGYMAKFRAGRILRMRAFREPEQALEAVGLRE